MTLGVMTMMSAIGVGQRGVCCMKCMTLIQGQGIVPTSGSVWNAKKGWEDDSAISFLGGWFLVRPR